MNSTDPKPQHDPLAAFIVTACAPLDRGHASGTLDRAEAILTAHPELARANIHTAAMLVDGGRLLADFAGTGNTNGVRHLLDLGVDVRALFKEGDGYWDDAKDSTALHVAAWRARHATVKLLIERGAAIDLSDGKGRTPLALAVRACVDSFWTERRSPESVQALLNAGAKLSLPMDLKVGRVRPGEPQSAFRNYSSFGSARRFALP